MIRIHWINRISSFGQLYRGNWPKTRAFFYFFLTNVYKYVHSSFVSRFLAQELHFKFIQRGREREFRLNSIQWWETIVFYFRKVCVLVKLNGFIHLRPDRKVWLKVPNILEFPFEFLMIFFLWENPSSKFSVLIFIAHIFK